MGTKFSAKVHQSGSLGTKFSLGTKSTNFNSQHELGNSVVACKVYHDACDQGGVQNFNVDSCLHARDPKRGLGIIEVQLWAMFGSRKMRVLLFWFIIRAW